MSAVSTRLADVTDKALVAHLIHALLMELSGGKASSIESVAETAEAVLGDPSVHILLAYHAEEPVGILTLNECMAIYAGGKFGEISELYVVPDRRSEGVAPVLLARVMKEAETRGWKRLEVGAPDQPAWKRTLDFYRRNGFEEVGPRLRRLVQ